MRALIAGLILAWPFATNGWAIDVDGIHKEHRPIVVTHEADERIVFLFVSGNQWMQLGEDHFDRQVDGRTVVSAPPGQYVVTLAGSQIVVVTPEDKPGPSPPDPRPNPGPDPKPEPEPKPNPDQLLTKWVVFLEERQERSKRPEQTAVITSDRLRKTMAESGITVTAYDEDSPDAGAFVSIADGRRPAMILIESKEKYKVLDVPNSVDEAERVIRENTLR